MPRRIALGGKDVELEGRSQMSAVSDGVILATLPLSLYTSGVYDVRSDEILGVTVLIGGGELTSSSDVSSVKA